MGRKVSIRTNYRNDALFLSRLVEAVSLDDKKGGEWKEKVIQNLNEVITLFLTDEK